MRLPQRGLERRCLGDEVESSFIPHLLRLVHLSTVLLIDMAVR